MVFTKEELDRLKPKNLIILATYLDIPLPPRIKKGTIIKKILDRFNPPVIPIEPDIEYLPGETQENPLYSARIRRIVKNKLEGEK